jgi:hypothetical protein
MYANWKLQHFGILELQSFSFLQKLSSIVQSRFLSVNQGQSLIPLHLNSSFVIDAIFLDSAHVQLRTQHQSAWVAHMFKRKMQIPDPLNKFPTVH